VRFTCSGGSLVTFPEPATQQADGTPLDTARLWPHVPRRARWLSRGRLLSHLLVRWALPYYLHARWKTARLSPGALHLSDLIEPALVGQAAPLRAATLRCAGTEDALAGDLRLLAFPEAGEVLLRQGTTSAGYRVPVGRGASALLGTILGGAYVTSRYYALSPRDRLALRRFAVRLLEPAAPRRIVPDEALEVETVARLSPDGGCLLFVVNRLGAQKGTVRFPVPRALNVGEPLRADLLFSAYGSSVAAVAEGLRLDLAADDVLIVRLR
jgi:hypothetical protein